MQILRLLAARRFRRRRRGVSTITATATAPATPRSGCGAGVYGYGEEEDEGPFFDLDLTCCSAPASTAGSQAAESGSESEDTSSSSAAGAARGDLDFVISLQRSRSASPSYEERLFFRGAAPPRPAPPPPPPPLMFCASEPSDAASRARHSSASRRGAMLQLRTLSFGSAKAALYGGRASFSRSTGSARSAGLFAAAYGSPDQDLRERDEGKARPPSGDVIRRYLSKIGLRLRKSRSASAAAAQSPRPPARRDDSLVEKQDGIASAIAHCKESLHRASVSEVDTSLVRSRSDLSSVDDAGFRHLPRSPFRTPGFAICHARHSALGTLDAAAAEASR